MDLCQSPHLAGRQMSSSLKERLKRSARRVASPVVSPLVPNSMSRSHFIAPSSSPLSSPCASIGDGESITNAENTLERSDVRSLPCSLEEIKACDDKDKLLDLFCSLTSLTAQQEEKLRKLRLVQLYHSKHDPVEFEKLIQKWKSAVQEALKKLYEILSEPKPELTELINHLQLDHELIGYNKDEETFM